MLDDAFALTIDKMFPPVKNNYLYPMKHESNDDNLWELIVDMKKWNTSKEWFIFFVFGLEGLSLNPVIVIILKGSHEHGFDQDDQN